MRNYRFTILLTLVLVADFALAQACFESSIVKPSPFMGNDGEVFQLADGSLWEVQHEYEYLYEYYPDVVVCPERGVLIVEDSRLNVVLLSTGAAQSSKDPKTKEKSTVIESQIDGDFEGWEGETIVKLVNGEIWQQSEYHYEYMYSFMPEVLIYQSGGVYKMKVEGADETVGVIRLK